MSLSYDSRGAKRNFCEADVTNFMPKLWRKTSTYYPVWSMVQWAPKPTCERVRCSFLQLVACLKHRTNVRRKTNKQTSSVFLPTKDRGSQDVLGTLKPFRLCTVVLMLVPYIILSNSELNSYYFGWLAVFWWMICASIHTCFNDYLLQIVDIYNVVIILPYDDVISYYFDRDFYPLNNKFFF